MNSLILYKTKWDSTREYADFVHENIAGSDIFPIDDFDPDNLKSYDLIIIGSRTYMGNIEARNFLVENWSKLKDKNVYLFVVGLFPANWKQSKDSYEQIPQDIRDNIKYTKVQGRIDMSKLNFFEKIITRIVKAPQENRVDLTSLSPFINQILIENI